MVHSTKILLPSILILLRILGACGSVDCDDGRCDDDVTCDGPYAYCLYLKAQQRQRYLLHAMLDQVQNMLQPIYEIPAIETAIKHVGEILRQISVTLYQINGRLNEISPSPPAEKHNPPLKEKHNPPPAQKHNPPLAEQHSPPPAEKHNPRLAIDVLACDEKRKYTTYNGVYNNLKHPKSGAVGASFERFWEDGEIPTVQNARTVSNKIFPSKEKGVFPSRVTMMANAFGQFITHDIVLVDVPKVPDGCCGKDGSPILKDPSCMPIEVPEGDPCFEKKGVKCLDFVRATTTNDHKQLNTVTTYIDGSAIYGSSEEKAKSLRKKDKSGSLTFELDTKLIKTSRTPPANKSNRRDFFRKYRFPQSVKDPEDVCYGRKQQNGESCYDFGDKRGVQNHPLSILHILFVREHNRVANIFHQMNKKWDVETVFLETRRYIAAILQRIVMFDWLPALLGKEEIFRNEFKIIIPEHNDFVDWYKEDEEAHIFNEYDIISRILHLAIPNHPEYKRNYTSQESVDLSSTINVPHKLENPTVFETQLLDMVFQPQRAIGSHSASEITCHLFDFEDKTKKSIDDKTKKNFDDKTKKKNFDLIATDIQRDYDFKVPSYNRCREDLGYSVAKNFEDFDDLIGREDIQLLRKVFQKPDDVPLFVGAALEDPSGGSIFGPCATQLFIDQFDVLSKTDRFFFWNEGQPGSFTPRQLKEISKVSLARIICDNADISANIPQNVFLLEDSTTNQVVPCREIKRVNLEAWRE